MIALDQFFLYCSLAHRLFTQILQLSDLGIGVPQIPDKLYHDIVHDFFCGFQHFLYFCQDIKKYGFIYITK